MNLTPTPSGAEKSEQFFRALLPLAPREALEPPHTMFQVAEARDSGLTETPGNTGFLAIQGCQCALCELGRPAVDEISHDNGGRS
jgi:hypothetical protein